MGLVRLQNNKQSCGYESAGGAIVNIAVQEICDWIVSTHILSGRIWQLDSSRPHPRREVNHHQSSLAREAMDASFVLQAIAICNEIVLVCAVLYGDRVPVSRVEDRGIHDLTHFRKDSSSSYLVFTDIRPKIEATTKMNVKDMDGGV
jgi:hypothetical protein